MKRLALAVLLPLLTTSPLQAAVYDVKLLFDTDRNPSTGCTVSTPGGNFSGVELIVTTNVTTSGATATTTGVTRQFCVGGVFGPSITVDSSTWPVGFSAAGDFLLETHVPRSLLPSGPMRLAVVVTSPTDGSALLVTSTGGDIVYPPRTGQRRAVVPPGTPRTIRLDGLGGEWEESSLLATGGSGNPGLRITSFFAFEAASDDFFRIEWQVNPNAPTANPDTYNLSTPGGTLNVASPGVLTNDTDPNHLPLTAILVHGPAHASSFTLNANGSFTYVNDGSPFPLDGFLYKASNGTLQSNTAPVIIGIGTFGPQAAITSADHTTFTAGSAGTFTVTTTPTIPAPAITEAGPLPAGVTFTDNGNGTATLHGTPAPGTGGIYTLLFTATNAVGTTSQTFTLTVNEAPSITSANNTTFTVGQAGSFTVTVTGFPTPTVGESGTLPTGVTFNAGTKTLGGTPGNNTAGNYPIIFTASNGVGSNATQNFTLHVICPTILLTPASLPAGTVLFTYNQTITASGGKGPYTFALFSGALPPGVAFYPVADVADVTRNQGLLFGEPAVNGTFTFSVRATDSLSCSVVQAYSLTINCPLITVNPATVPNGTQNVAYPSQTFSELACRDVSYCIGGSPFSFARTAGAFPRGLTLTGGVLSGTPTVSGTFNFTITATSASGCTGSRAYTMSIDVMVFAVWNDAFPSLYASVAQRRRQEGDEGLFEGH